MKETVPYHVLIVDENLRFAQSLRDMIVDVAGKCSVFIQYAHNYKEGFSMIRDNAFHYVFMNTDLFDTDGVSAIHYIDYVYNKPNMKIIAISYRNELNYRLQVIRAGASSYLNRDEIEKSEIAEIFQLRNVS
jgi:DNA-binding NarL/FixJ family response regulator